MKTQLRWLLAGSLAAASLAAPAQSSLTLYGVVDLNLNVARSGSTRLTRLEDEGRNHSRIGLRGTEDLGNGLKTLFVLEGSVLADTGRGVGAEGGFQFNRQAYLALDAPWGRVSAGRMYTPQFIATSRADPLEINARWSPMLLMYTSDAQPGLRTYASRANNMIRWRSPARQPWYADLGYAFGEVPSPNSNNGRIISAALGWDQKPFMLLYGLQKANEGTAASPVAAPRASFSRSVSAAWDYSDALRFSGNYVINKLERSPSPVADATIVSLAAAWQVTARNKLMLIGAHRRVKDSERKQFSWTLGVDHSLSRRTYLYARYRHLDNSGNSSVSMGGIPMVADSGNSARAFSVGIRHAF